MAPTAPTHIPVLLAATLQHAALKKEARALDATLGLAGHAREFLKKMGPNGKLVAFEADAENLSLARKNLAEFPNRELHHANFRTIKNYAQKNYFDLIFFDLGVASPQLDVAERGFSFQRPGPLDLRFDRRQILTAAGFLNGATEFEIARVLREFGEIGIAKKIARKIIEFRQRQKFQTTQDLADLIQPVSLRPQVFQALRILVNDELTSLKIALQAVPNLLRRGGKIGVIAFHSLEDRIVKNFLRESLELKVLTKKPIKPSSAEQAQNPRARSARLRFAVLE